MRTVGREVRKRAEHRARKRPFDIDEMVARIREAVRPFPKAAMFALREAGYGTLYQQLVACILSIRTRDEVSLPVSIKLFERAATPEEMVKVPVGEIDQIIRACTFHEAKAPQIVQISRQILDQYGGELPADLDVLASFRGVGPKCANLALGVATGKAGVSVDIHVHRVTNRWGYVETRSPEATMDALQTKLPKEYWIEINSLLVPFGKHICTGTLPKCSTCPVLEFCRQVGVTEHR
jgi:endonuclease III